MLSVKDINTQCADLYVRFGTVSVGGTSGNVLLQNASSSVQESSSKVGKAPLAVGDLAAALPNSTTSPPDLTANMTFIDGKEAPSADYYA